MLMDYTRSPVWRTVLDQKNRVTVPLIMATSPEPLAPAFDKSAFAYLNARQKSRTGCIPCSGTGHLAAGLSHINSLISTINIHWLIVPLALGVFFSSVRRRRVFPMPLLSFLPPRWPFMLSSCSVRWLRPAQKAPLHANRLSIAPSPPTHIKTPFASSPGLSSTRNLQHFYCSLKCRLAVFNILVILKF